jgi:hypothetical protein
MKLLNELLTLEEGYHDPSAASKDNFLVIADHRDLDESVIKELKTGLKKLGIFTYTVPGTSGSDTHCLVFSKKAMTSKELKVFNVE